MIRATQKPVSELTQAERDAEILALEARPRGFLSGKLRGRNRTRYEELIGAKPQPPQRRAEGWRKVQRNEPCPCGSGKKHKRCCGAAGRTMEVKAEGVSV